MMVAAPGGGLVRCPKIRSDLQIAAFRGTVHSFPRIAAQP